MSKRFLLALIFIIFFILFFIQSSVILDPDFGWHLRMGNYILTYGIPKTDPFSYTMPSYPFIDHEWLSNVLIAKLYALGGIPVLSALFSVIATAALFLPLLVAPKRWLSIPIVLTGFSLLELSGIRNQEVSWLFFSVILVIVFSKHYLKLRYFLPIIFLMWANLHGAFVSGLLLLLIASAVKMFLKKIQLTDIFIVVLSILITLINPYHMGLWHEVWISFSDTSLHWRIAEWEPAFLRPSLSFWVLFVLSVILAARCYKKIQLSLLAAYSVFLVFAVSSVRNIPFWSLLAVIVIPLTMSFFVTEVSRYKDGVQRLQKAYTYLFVIVLLILLPTLKFQFSNVWVMSENAYYPKNAVNYLHGHLLSGNLLSVYNWGGYLIWKYPSKKVYIDGRMPSWHWQAPRGESNNAYLDYTKLTNKFFLENQIKKYQITQVLLPKEVKNSNFFKLKLAPFETEPQEQVLSKEFKKLGWKVVYQDNIAVIYQKN